MKLKTLIGLLVLGVAMVVGSVPAFAETIPCTLEWTANTEPDLKGYRVYFSTTPPPALKKMIAQLGKVTTYDCSGPADNLTHYYHLTAIDDAGERTDDTRNPDGDNESDATPTVSKSFKGTVTPLTFTVKAVTPAVAGQYGYEAVASRPLVTGEKFEFWVDGVLKTTEGGFPYCSAQLPTTLVCGTVPGTLGAHKLEVKLIVNNVLVSSQIVNFTISIPDTGIPKAPIGFTIK